MASMTTVFAVIYAAKSSPDPKNSIGTQLEDCRRLAEQEGLQIIGEYEDENASAYHGDRGAGLTQAMLHARQLADEGAQVALCCQHSDRLARGDGKEARHLVELVLWARKHEITLRSVEDPQTFDGMGLVYAALMGDRNYDDSKRKAAATSAGKKRAAERGEPQFGICPDGYTILKEFNSEGAIRRTMEFDPERAPIYELIWQLASEGYGRNSIVVELDKHGYVTSPRKSSHRPRPFDASRVRQTLDNPTYAGLVVHKGEIVGVGRWPAFVSVEEFHRLKAERAQRGHVQQPRVGRPPEGYVLARVARCGVCGAGMETVTGRSYRKDGSRAKRYVCHTHRERPQSCAAKPIDAGIVDRAFVANLTSFLGDVAGWHEQLVSEQATERARMRIEIERAELEAVKIAKRLGKLQRMLDRALDEDDDQTARATQCQLVRNQGEAELAVRRLRAAEDALAATEAAQDYDALLDFFGRLREALTERTRQAADDIKKINLVVRDFFAAVRLSSQPEGIRVEPHLSRAAVARIVAGYAAPPLSLHHALYDPEAVMTSDMPPLKPLSAPRANAHSPSWTGDSAWSARDWWFGAFLAVEESERS
jgi:site-specific DNA recombinase